MSNGYERSEELLTSRMQHLSNKIHAICTKYDIPRIHGCIWDRHCRHNMPVRRISVFWRRHVWMVDLPGYDKPMTWSVSRNGGPRTTEHRPGKWQILPQFRHSLTRRP